MPLTGTFVVPVSISGASAGLPGMCSRRGATISVGPPLGFGDEPAWGSYLPYVGLGLDAGVLFAVMMASLVEFGLSVGLLGSAVRQWSGRLVSADLSARGVTHQ